MAPERSGWYCDLGNCGEEFRREPGAEAVTCRKVARRGIIGGSKAEWLESDVAEVKNKLTVEFVYEDGYSEYPSLRKESNGVGFWDALFV